MALTAARRITSRQDNPRSIPVSLADGYTFYDGAVLVIDAASGDGLAHPATKKTGLTVVGLFAPKFGSLASNGRVVTSESNSGVVSDCIVGVYDLDNGSNSDAITQADVGNLCYLLDDHTVSRLSSSASAAGRIVAVNADGTIQVDLAFAGVLNE